MRGSRNTADTLRRGIFTKDDRGLIYCHLLDKNYLVRNQKKTIAVVYSMIFSAKELRSLRRSFDNVLAMGWRIRACWQKICFQEVKLFKHMHGFCRTFCNLQTSPELIMFSGCLLWFIVGMVVVHRGSSQGNWIKRNGNYLPDEYDELWHWWTLALVGSSVS